MHLLRLMYVFNCGFVLNGIIYDVKMNLHLNFLFCALNLSHKRKDYYTKHWWYGISLNDIVHTKAVCINFFLLSFTLHDSFRSMVHLEGRVVVDLFLVGGCAWSLRWQSHLCKLCFFCLCEYLYVW
jgi:hypothetical protein